MTRLLDKRGIMPRSSATTDMDHHSSKDINAPPSVAEGKLKIGRELNGFSYLRPSASSETHPLPRIVTVSMTPAMVVRETTGAAASESEALQLDDQRQRGTEDGKLLYGANTLLAPRAARPRHSAVGL